MRSWFLRWVLSVIGIILTTYIVPGFEVTVFGAFIGSIVFGFVNATIRPILLIFTLPINLLTLGLFTLVINGFMLWLVGFAVKGFELQSFSAAFFAALCLMIINSLVNYLVKK